MFNVTLVIPDYPDDFGAFIIPPCPIPPCPDDEMPDSERDRLFEELFARIDAGEFDENHLFI